MWRTFEKKQMRDNNSTNVYLYNVCNVYNQMRDLTVQEYKIEKKNIYTWSEIVSCS
jgi:hypothetical protein